MIRSLLSCGPIWRVWTLAAVYRVILQYRRTFLGTFWLAVTMIAIVLVKSFLFSDLLGVPNNRLLPSLAMGMAFWAWVNQLVIGSASAFMSHRALLTQSNYSLFVPILSNISSAFFIFIHGFFAMLMLNFKYHSPNLTGVLLTIGAIILVVWCTIAGGYVLAHVCTRFRDMDRFIRSVMSVMFILTPVIWLPELVGEKKKVILEFNPLYHILETMRDPIIGQPIEWINWKITALIGVVCWTLAFMIDWRHKRNILLWL